NGTPLCEACPMAEICTARREGSIDALPYKTKKAARRIEERTVLLLTDGAHLGLVRRPENGLLAGLYEPMNLCGAYDEDAIRKALCDFGIREDAIGAIVPVGQAKHIFTHIEWHMTGYRVELSDLLHPAEIVFPSLREVEASYAIPSAYRFYMREFSAYAAEKH
ncbi:MAG: NUDIX domain-containing protein, partial [Clostridia bacterium]|nr:NUDIX domain-containing protein [Clostridia bacterium]